MKSILMYSLLAAAMLLTVAPLHAVTNMQRGEVLSVAESHPQPLCCYDGTDTPLQFSANDYNLKVQVGAKVYDVEYETALDYFPSSLVKGANVDVRLTHFQMFLETPDGGELKTVILHRHNAKTPIDGAKVSA